MKVLCYKNNEKCGCGNDYFSLKVEKIVYECINMQTKSHSPYVCNIFVNITNIVIIMNIIIHNIHL